MPVAFVQRINVNVLWKLLTEKEKLVLERCGRCSASALVRELNMEKGWAKSSLWYTLKKLKKKGVITWDTGILTILK